MGCDHGFFLRASEANDSKSVGEATVQINAIEAIESYTSSHPERISEILYEWPWQKFEALYEAHVKREQTDKAANERLAYITGIIANTNLDDGKQSKTRALESIDINYQDMVKSIYNVIEKDIVDLKNDPFFAAMKIPGQYEPEESTTVPEPHDEVAPEIEVDQQ